MQGSTGQGRRSAKSQITQPRTKFSLRREVQFMTRVAVDIYWPVVDWALRVDKAAGHEGRVGLGWLRNISLRWRPALFW